MALRESRLTSPSQHSATPPGADNPGFQPQASTRRHEVAAHVAAAIAQGVEIWQVNLLIDPSGVRVGSTSNITARFA